MSRWHPDQLPCLHGKTALVTGANRGLGLETAKALASLQASVVVTCRGPEKAESTIEEIRRHAPSADVSAIDLDLNSLASVKSAADQFQSNHSQLDILVNNAGVMGLPRMETEDGFERVFGVNHLGHFALTGRLLSALDAAPAARIVSVTSLTARKATLPMDDLHWQRRPYHRARAYAQSKLANLSFAVELERRLRAAQLSATSLAAHPGYAATNVAFALDAAMSVGRQIWSLVASTGNVLLAQAAERGAWPILHAAAMPHVSGGALYGPDGLLEFRGLPTKLKVSPLAHQMGEALWAASERLTQVRYL